jgi:hypothetical protein
MAMKAYRHELRYSPLLDLLSGKANICSGQQDGKGYVLQESPLAKIVGDSLLVRQMETSCREKMDFFACGSCIRR